VNSFVDRAEPGSAAVGEDVTPTGSAWKRAVVASAVMGGVAAAILFSGLKICPIAIITRHPCPGCGMTRAVLCAFHGDLSGSLHYHPLAFVMLPILAWVLGRNWLGYVRRGVWSEGEGRANKAFEAFLVVVAVAMISLWIARFFGFLGGPVPV
jgi:hypothetical protein